jgi:pyruvate/2-oxoglutarate dehydrogenase complex dihydrolipoamide acyltransferase (E2) component
MPEFKLPDLGEGVTEAEIDRWLVREGQEVHEDDLLVEVITDKATAEIPSPFSGTVARLHVNEGDIVPVGTVLVTIGEPGASTLEGTVEDLFQQPGTDSGPDLPSDEDIGAVTESDTEPAVTAEAGEDGASPSATPRDGMRGEEGGAAERTGTPAGDNAEERAAGVKAMPPIRKLARDLGVDINGVTGSGPGGRILREDVEAVAAAPAGSRELSGTRVEFRGVRRMIAEHMLKAHGAIPPVTHVEECDITELDEARRLANERNPEGTKLSLLAFVVKATVTALKEHPALNSTLDEDANEIVYHDRYDIGVAVDTPNGLVVPVVRGADSKNVRAIATEIERLAGAAREGSLGVDELRGSTFTITSPGRFAGLMATPIINYPEAAILGVHRAMERPVVRNGQILVRTMMNLSITFDHRLLDGVAAAKFCIDLVRLLEHPTVLALES